MKKKDCEFVWSDGWCIEQNKAWFIGARENILFCLDLDTNICKYAVGMPEGARAFRSTPRCIKCENEIFCMPERGNSIWVYNLDSKNFTEIGINNPDNVHIELKGIWKSGNRIFAVSFILGQVIEINLVRKEVAAYYVLSDVKEEIADAIRIGNEIYCLYGSGRICIFNMETKLITSCELPDIGRKFHCLCFAGDRFWLSGYRKELYIWNRVQNTIAVVDGFPDDFGEYSFSQDTNGSADCKTEEYEKPTFLYSIAAEGKIWFIPFQTNKIIYADQTSDKLCVFEIEEEDETSESLLKHECAGKYILEYVKEKRYLGLFSLKNRQILEIDARQLTYKWCDYSFSNKCMRQCTDIFDNMLQERYSFEMYLLCNGMHDSGNSYVNNTNQNNVGKKIYQSVLNTL